MKLRVSFWPTKTSLSEMIGWDVSEFALNTIRGKLKKPPFLNFSMDLMLAYASRTNSPPIGRPGFLSFSVEVIAKTSPSEAAVLLKFLDHSGFSDIMNIKVYQRLRW